MTDRRRQRTMQRHLNPADRRERGDTARVLPLGGVASLAVSADVVRAKLGAWAGLCAADERPDLDMAWREVLLALNALVEAGGVILGAGSLPAWERAVPVPREPLDLQLRAALSRGALRRAVDRAISAELLDLESRVGDELVVRVRPDIFADAPVVAAINWSSVRLALDTQISPVALLLVREIARRTTPERRAQGEVVPISLREFVAATGASKGTIQKALRILNAVGLVESRTRDRVDSWHRLQPPAFGEMPVPLPAAQEASDEVSADRRSSMVAASSHVAEASGDVAQRAEYRGWTAPSPLEPGAPHEAQPLRSSPASPSMGATVMRASSGANQPAPAGSGGAVTMYEVDGITWPLPSGVHPRLERDADGAPMRRIGNLRLPIRRTPDPEASIMIEVDGILWELLPGARPQLECEPDGSYWYRMDGERWPFRPD